MIILHLFAIYGLLSFTVDVAKLIRSYRLKKILIKQFEELTKGGKL